MTPERELRKGRKGGRRKGGQEKKEIFDGITWVAGETVIRMEVFVGGGMVMVI